MSREHGEIIADLDNLVRPFLVLYIRSLRTNHFQTVSVRDFGSLHGTYVNHEMERIPGRTLHELHDGDEISFGAAILRNGDSYTPTRVKVGIEFNNGYLPSSKPLLDSDLLTCISRSTHNARRSTFAVPEGSDIEEDGYSSDDCKEIPKPATVDWRASPARATETRSFLDKVIDLTDNLDATHDGDQDRTADHIVDLTADATASFSPLEPQAMRDWFEQEVPEYRASAIRESSEIKTWPTQNSQPAESDLDSEDPDSEDDGISESDMDSSDSIQEYSDSGDNDTDLDDALADEFDAGEDYSSDDDMLDPGNIFSGPMLADRFTLFNMPLADDPDTIVWGNYPFEAVTAKEAGETPNTTVPADATRAEAAPAEVTTTTERTLAEVTMTEESPVDIAPTEGAPADEVPIHEPSALPPNDNSAPSLTTRTNDDKAAASLPRESEPEANAPRTSTLARPTIPSILNPVPASHGTDNPAIPNGSRRQTPLVNDSTTVASDTVVGKSQNAHTLVGESRPVEPAPVLPKSSVWENLAELLPPGDGPVDPPQVVAMFPLLAAGDDFLNSPGAFPERPDVNQHSHVPSQEFKGAAPAPGTETSAYEFQQTKLKSLLHEGLSQGDTRRTHMGIADLLDNCPHPSDVSAPVVDPSANSWQAVSSSKTTEAKHNRTNSDDVAAAYDEIVETERRGLKRKSDAISSLSNAERRWESSASTNSGTNKSPGPPGGYPTAALSYGPNDTNTAGSQQSKIAPRLKMVSRLSKRMAGQNPTKIPSGTQAKQTDDARPAKRMRLRGIAEKIGYAALGGATVGAAIMTTLIYTAPSFT